MQHERTILHALRDQAVRELQTELCAGPRTYWNGFRDAMSLALEATRPQSQSAQEKRVEDSFDADDGPNPDNNGHDVPRDANVEGGHNPDGSHNARNSERRPRPKNDIPNET